MERLTDLDELTTRCRTASAKEHIAEAIASYRGGAYRAAIVMSWIAVVFDLVDKVRELSLAGEAAATGLLKTFESYQTQIHQGSATAMKQALEFERELLGRVRTDLSLIDALQLSDLERLREDRHRSAHPSYNLTGDAFRPPAELARLHLRNAIAHVLSKPPIQGKAALNRLRALITSEYFPLDLPKARTQLASSALANPSESLVRAFVDEMIFGYVEPASEYHELPQVLAALSVTLDMHRGIAEPRVAQQVQRVIRTASDADMPTAVAFVASWPTAWEYLEAAERDKIAEFVTYSGFADLVESLPGLAKIVELEASLKERLPRLSTEQLEKLIPQESLAVFVAEAAVAKYVKAPTFALARGRRRRLIMPLLDQLTRRHVEAIIAGAGSNNQIREENFFPTFLKRLRALESMPDDIFISIARDAGIVEMLDEDEDEI